MKSTWIFAWMTVLTLGIPGVAIATGTASGATAGSGTVLEDPVWATRRAVDEGFENAVRSGRKAESAFVSQQATRIEKRAELLIQCKEDLRRANRDTLFHETLRCFRSFLVGDLEMTRKEKQFAEGLAGASKEATTAASTGLASLMDATQTVLNGIDAGIYQTKDDLLEAKSKLESKYRIPAMTALMELRLSRRAAWINHLLVRLKDLEEDPTLTPEITGDLGDAIACFEAKTSDMANVPPAMDSGALVAQIGGSATDLLICTEKARAAYAAYQEWEQAKTASGSTTK